MSNPTYVEKFAFLGPHIKNREKYLKDHDHDTENNFLQSDVVSILLNLCAIPDDVARKLELNYFDSYYNIDFQRHMDEYKNNFSKLKGTKWTYTNESNIDHFIERCNENGPKHRTEKYLNDLRNKK